MNAINKNQMTGAIFLDLTKAFDLVNHNLLIEKLTAYRFSSLTISLLSSYLEKRSQYVYVNGKSSSKGIIKRGVPQGSILGPILFSLFINDLPLHISCPNVTCSLFADDCSLDMSSPDLNCITSSLQASLDEISDWSTHNEMIPNPSKTTCMLITTRQKHQLKPPSLSLTLSSKPVEQVRHQRVLGITIDDRLCWQVHTERLCKSISKNLFLLTKLKYLTDEPTRKLFYLTHIQPHINYISTAWDGASENNLKNVNSLHRRAIKLIAWTSNLLPTTDAKFEYLKIFPLKTQFTYNKLVFMYKITNNLSPPYLSQLFKLRDTPYEALWGNLTVPTPRIDLYKSSLLYSGSKLWNELPKSIKYAPSLSSFKNRLELFLR